MRRLRAERICLLAVVLTGALLAWAQQPQRPGAARRAPADRRSQPRSEAPPIVIEPTAPIANLFARAEDGIARNDWKFAVDCLQRIIDDPEDSMVEVPEGSKEKRTIYESARRRAVRRLAALPPEGLEAYRLLYDGRAKRLYEQGRTGHDAASLSAVVARYPLTRFADDAADLLASWALDAGRSAEVVRTLNDLLELTPDRDVPDVLVYGKLAAAYALLGRGREAEKAVAQLQADPSPTPSVAPRVLTDALAALQTSDDTRWDERRIWPFQGGDAHRRNQMPEVEPTLTAAAPWRFELPGSDGDPWRRIRQPDLGSPASFPAGQAAADERRLFVRTRWGVTALALDDLTPLWQTDDLLGETYAAEAPRAELRLRGANPWENWTEEAAFDDYAAGAVGRCQGLVTMLSRQGTGEYAPQRPDAGALEELPPVPMAPPGPPAPGMPGMPTTRALTPGANRLLALDPETGGIRWQRGRTLDSRDPLANVEFLSIPIAVEGKLFVPYRRWNDLLVAVLDPIDGVMERCISLCSLNRASGNPWFSLPPAAADGLVFVPTARGVVFAIETADQTIRWASQYSEGTPDPPSSETRTTLWPGSAPVVSGGGLLVASPQERILYYLATASGELLWSAPMGRCSYIIAADSERVWLGGRSVTCMSLSDGAGLWTTDLTASPTGQAVLSGTTIHAPTTSALVSLDAECGEVRRSSDVPASIGPLGNLLCWKNSVFTLNPGQVRKFPDLRRSYESALTEHRARPDDDRAAIGLAWLELFRQQPRRALEALDTLADGVYLRKDVEGDAASRVRVETLLMLAAAVDPPSPEGDAVLPLLEEASSLARSPSDRLRCAVATVNRLRTENRFAEAYDRLWRLGLSSDTAQVTPLDDQVLTTARFDIARRLEQIAPLIPPRQQEELLATIQRNVEQAAGRLAGKTTGGEDEALLVAVVDLAPPSRVRETAVQALAGFHTRLGRYEHAEQLHRGLNPCESTPADGHVLSSLLQVCRLYTELSTLDERVAHVALTMLDGLGSRFGASALPDPKTAAKGQRPTEPASVGEWVEQERSRFASKLLEAHRERRGDGPLQLTGQQLWMRELGNSPTRPILIDFAEPRPALLAERILLATPDNQVTCHEATSIQDPVWRTTLRLPGRFESEITSFQRQGNPVERRAVADGQTAVLATDEGLFAVGLVTGRRLWVRPFEPSGSGGRRSESPMLMAVGDGFLAATPRAGRLSLLRLLDGTSIWERDLYGEPLGRIFFASDRVVTVDPTFQRVHLFDRASGRLVKRILFGQPDPDAGLVDFAVSGEILCGPVAATEFEGVEAMNLRTGETLWRLPVEKPLAQIFRPAEGYVGVSLLGGDVWILDAADGEVLINWRVPGANIVLDGLLVDTTFVVQHITADGDGRLHHLTGFDVATQEELWRRTDLLPTPKGTKPLRLVGGMIPAFVVPLHDRPRANQDIRAALIDPRTGLASGVMTPLPAVNAASRVPGDFLVLPAAGAAVLQTPGAISAIRTEVSGGGTQKGL